MHESARDGDALKLPPEKSVPRSPMLVASLGQSRDELEGARLLQGAPDVRVGEIWIAERDVHAYAVVQDRVSCGT